QIRVQQGVPVRLVFDRRETGECTSRVVFPDFMINQGLPPYPRAAVELVPAEAGTFGFACGMNMVHGTLIVDPSTGDGDATPPPSQDVAHHDRHGGEDP